VDAIIAQGLEAGGYRGMFRSCDAATQLGMMALVPQVADAIEPPVIAASGIADARGIVAAFAPGASAVQIRTAYLYCPEATVSRTHWQAVNRVRDDQTVITSVFSGRPARVISNRIVGDLAFPAGVPGLPLGRRCYGTASRASGGRWVRGFHAFMVGPGGASRSPTFRRRPQPPGG